MARLGPCSAFSAHTYGRFFKNKHAFTAAPSTEAQLQTTEKRGQICTQITNIPLHWSVPGSPPGRSPGLPAGERGWSGRGAVSHPFRGRPRKLRRASQFPNLKSEVQNSVIRPSYGPFRAVFGVFGAHIHGVFFKRFHRCPKHGGTASYDRKTWSNLHADRQHSTALVSSGLATRA